MRPNQPLGGIELQDPTQARILIVEDDPDSVELLKLFFETSGYSNLRTTHDPRTAGRDFQDFRPDVVLLDLHMPHIDGIGVMRELSSLSNGGVPMVVMSGDVSPGVKELAEKAGATDFVVKPYELSSLLGIVENSLSRA